VLLFVIIDLFAEGCRVTNFSVLLNSQMIKPTCFTSSWKFVFAPICGYYKYVVSMSAHTWWVLSSAVSIYRYVPYWPFFGQWNKRACTNDPNISIG